MNSFGVPHLIRVGILTCLAWSAEIQSHGAQEAFEERENKPNVLMIVVDDMNDWVGCLGGHPDIQTPNIDRLARRGMLFTNAHAPSPVCNPSRVAVMTGLSPARTGVYDNKSIWYQWLPKVVSIPSHFKQNGYHVLGGGKVYHHMPGFNRRSDWHGFFDQRFDGHYQDQLSRGLNTRHFQWPEHYPLNGLPSVQSLMQPPKNPREFDWGPIDKPENETGDGKMVDWAVKHLSEPRKEPFFLAAGIYRPHLPFYAPRKYFEMYPSDEIKLPPIRMDDLDDLPSAGKMMAQNRAADFDLVQQSGQYRSIVRAYLASISFADAMVGRLLDALDAGPASRNTIIVFWSDHGWHLGEKQRLHKMTLWERSTRIPFIITDPTVTKHGARCAKPVSAMDIFPTLNALCGLPAVGNLDGFSLAPLLVNPSSDWDIPARTTYGRGNHALRSERWRYIRYANGDEELYDHHRDPHEWKNLALDSGFEDIKAALSKWLPQANAFPLRRNKPHR